MILESVSAGARVKLPKGRTVFLDASVGVRFGFGRIELLQLLKRVFFTGAFCW